MAQRRREVGLSDIWGITTTCDALMGSGKENLSMMIVISEFLSYKSSAEAIVLSLRRRRIRNVTK